MRTVRALVAIMLVVAIIFFVIGTYKHSFEVQKACVRLMLGLVIALIGADLCCKDSGFKDSDYHGE